MPFGLAESNPGSVSAAWMRRVDPRTTQSPAKHHPSTRTRRESGSDAGRSSSAAERATARGGYRFAAAARHEILAGDALAPPVSADRCGTRTSSRPAEFLDVRALPAHRRRDDPWGRLRPVAPPGAG